MSLQQLRIEDLQFIIKAMPDDTAERVDCSDFLSMAIPPLYIRNVQPTDDVLVFDYEYRRADCDVWGMHHATWQYLDKLQLISSIRTELLNRQSITITERHQAGKS